MAQYNVLHQSYVDMFLFGSHFGDDFGSMSELSRDRFSGCFLASILGGICIGLRPHFCDFLEPGGARGAKS